MLRFACCAACRCAFCVWLVRLGLFSAAAIKDLATCLLAASLLSEAFAALRLLRRLQVHAEQRAQLHYAGKSRLACAVLPLTRNESAASLLSDCCASPAAPPPGAHFGAGLKHMLQASCS